VFAYLPPFLSRFKGNFFFDTFMLGLGLAILAMVSLGVVSVIMRFFGQEVGVIALIAFCISFIFNLFKRIP